MGRRNNTYMQDIASAKVFQNRTGLHVLNLSNSHIRNHSVFSNHPIFLNCFKVPLIYNREDFRLAEAILILVPSPTLNVGNGSVPLNIFS